MVGAFSVHGSNEQIFGVKEQILGPDQSDQGASARVVAHGCSGDSRDHPWDCPDVCVWEALVTVFEHFGLMAEQLKATVIVMMVGSFLIGIVLGSVLTVCNLIYEKLKRPRK